MEKIEEDENEEKVEASLQDMLKIGTAYDDSDDDFMDSLLNPKEEKPEP